MTKRQINFIDRVRKKNKRVIAQYLALYTECTHLKKCMITLTAPDNKLGSILEIRKDFFKKLNRYKRNKSSLDLSIKYFSNIEFSSKHIPHLHIQLFFTNKEPIERAYNKVINNHTHANNITFAKNHNKRFTYIIKDYMKLDLTLEKNKAHYKGAKYTTSSQKRLTNKLIRRMFKDKRFGFKTKNKYQEILTLIYEKELVISNGRYWLVKKE